MSKDTTLNIKTPKNLIATLPDYTLGEELINSISHGLGASFAIIALVLCVTKAVIRQYRSDKYKLPSPFHNHQPPLRPMHLPPDRHCQQLPVWFNACTALYYVYNLPCTETQPCKICFPHI